MPQQPHRQQLVLALDADVGGVPQVVVLHLQFDVEGRLYRLVDDPLTNVGEDIVVYTMVADFFVDIFPYGLHHSSLVSRLIGNGLRHQDCHKQHCDKQ